MRMADHTEQIKIIIATATSLTGQYYPKKVKLSAYAQALTKFLIIPLFDRSMSNTVQYSEFYEIHCEASSLANLEIAIEKFLAAQSGATSGYTQSTAAYPYWIGNMKVLKKEFNDHVFRAFIELEARWNF